MFRPDPERVDPGVSAVVRNAVMFQTVKERPLRVHLEHVMFQSEPQPPTNGDLVGERGVEPLRRSRGTGS
jgi:hypothetical protein